MNEVKQINCAIFISHVEDIIKMCRNMQKKNMTKYSDLFFRLDYLHVKILRIINDNLLIIIYNVNCRTTCL